MSDLQGKCIAVTGASSGIGSAITELLLARGARVFGLCRQIGKVPAGADRISCDLSQPERIGHAFEIIQEATGTLDALVNNAGVAWMERVSDGDPERFAQMWQVNVHGLIMATQHALKLFPASGGRIVNLSSMSGHRVPQTGGFYSPTKFAVRALTESLRSELAGDGSPHQVATVSPGFVDTAILDKYFEGREEKLSQLRESAPILRPADVADCVYQILAAPAHVNIGDIQLRPAGQKA
ncbi:SDR family oxidoreductase [Roseibacillus ishigakijimensis]|uniref:SDR family NAD(P)-dependent oxidoreductase n=1 Tax=Roseibacillus ishigakijimensis TaxID=454146 RepID=A0A934RLS9_9BACT|nr:SDR family NAD(P)-dependent oxidoreductase [Roseibacillus ishigakijimensis]MBK1833183.1 SDR family NAD(P)-dependent oxidoreductase [Roseibacillus ishigakijimensis]